MNLLFIIAGLMAVAGIIGVILAKQPVHQVLATVLNFLGLAALYLSLQSEFLAVIQLVVYGGAVMILFLFVIALLSARNEATEKDAGKLTRSAILGFSFGGALLVMLTLVAALGKEGARGFKTIGAEFGTTKAFGYELLTTHVLSFELLAFILMVAVIGVVILVGRQKA